jgi:amidase
VFSGTTELANAIRAGRVSAREVLSAHLAQIASHNPALNAVITLDAERASQRARDADDALARGETWGPLHGVPFTLKDAHATAGVRTTTGFPPLADYVPKEDGTVAGRLKAAGGVLIGKTNVPVMLADFQTGNPIFGRTNNPWDTARTPGGSSGGAAAALASGMTPFEIGTDLSASIRLPAHFCGVFGLKPTERRVPLTGLIPGLPGPRPLRIMSSIGPMARSVEDLALLYGIIAGPDGRDTEVPPVPVESSARVDLRDLRIAVAPTFPSNPVAAEIRGAVSQLATRLSPLCRAVEEPALPSLDFNQELASAGELVGMLIAAVQPNQQEPPTALTQYLQALDRRDQSIVAWEKFFDRWDVLLSPPSGMTAFPHCEPGSALLVDGQEVPYWSVSAYGAPFNYTGHPAVVLPFTRDRAGLPIGIQLVGKRWSESRLLAVAEALAAVSGAFQRPPGYSD